jgi:hypothetical protein
VNRTTLTDDLTPEQRATMAGALADTAPATGEQVRQALSDALSVTGHSHQPLIHERSRRVEAHVPAIVRRLLDAEAQAGRYRIAWRAAYQRAKARGRAADRAGARVRALQDWGLKLLGELLTRQMERDALAGVAGRMRLALESARRGRAQGRARVAALKADASRLHAAVDREHKAFIDTHNALNVLREDAIRVMAENGVQAQQAELERVREQAAKFRAQRGDWAKKMRTAEARITELEQQLTAARESAALVSQYRLPLDSGAWLEVSRDPNGDRWGIAHHRYLITAWTGEAWDSLEGATDDGKRWPYDTAEDALTEAHRLVADENHPG